MSRNKAQVIRANESFQSVGYISVDLGQVCSALTLKVNHLSAR